MYNVCYTHTHLLKLSAHSTQLKLPVKNVAASLFIKKASYEGAWVEQSVKRLTLDFHSGYDLPVHELQPSNQLCSSSAGPA